MERRELHDALAECHKPELLAKDKKMSSLQSADRLALPHRTQLYNSSKVYSGELQCKAAVVTTWELRCKSNRLEEIVGRQSRKFSAVKPP